MKPTNYVLGIDIGGTKMAVGVVRSNGRVLARQNLATEAELGFERAVDRLVQTGRALLQQCGVRAGELAGIGIGCAGPVDPVRGLINNPYTLGGWQQCDIVTPLRHEFETPVFLENDADLAALGECSFGAGCGFDPVVMLTFGTGIGGAAVVNGQVYRGARGEHPELGHVPVGLAGPACYCGHQDCLEGHASGTALQEAGRAHGFTDASQVFAAAQQGHATARQIVDRALAAATSAAWTFLHTFLPQRFILGGGIMEDHFELFAAAVDASIKTAALTPRGKISVVRAALGNDAALAGAAQLVFKPDISHA